MGNTKKLKPTKWTWSNVRCTHENEITCTELSWVCTRASVLPVASNLMILWDLWVFEQENLSLLCPVALSCFLSLLLMLLDLFHCDHFCFISLYLFCYIFRKWINKCKPNHDSKLRNKTFIHTHSFIHVPLVEWHWVYQPLPGSCHIQEYW